MDIITCVLWLEEVSSTQDVAKEKELPSGCVVVANRQLSGRGRRGRRWFSQEGGLYFSLLLRTAPIRDEQTITLVAAHAVCRFLQKEGVHASIKWVNDVYVKGKKISGALAERSKDKLILGIGINVNQGSFPEDVPAISMRMVTGKEYDKKRILLELLGFLEEDIRLLMNKGFSPFRDVIEERLLFLGEEVIVEDAGDITVGLLHHLGEDGSLVILTADGYKRILAGDVSLKSL
ncbi:biotin/acetyl-CoA-carboxylase ligase [Thermocrinis albus DSM 14484]|uniref:biotin--[biotin carboxyl-carrier protein] ligase n=1 Tax=Thermocrinis albus (strain DSM 14484 / JCM 11386 / HI 11/12) TaxID=638303 RepID=D3SP13_THEAH|nr:biotin--[acetyl-CoA-carboxylase] ligase [Thermocrinis albus]ADC88900.1 biotin/acetyl-CoA-carboxylase ligase [Thermocrinis albus DSM 14484]